MAHNYYQQPGGEDRSFAAEADVLETHGHTLHRYIKHNDAVGAMNKVALLRATLWNGDIYNELRDLFRSTRFDVAHFQNTFPLISPAAYYAAQAENIPVIQTLRNYRLICPNAIFFRDGHVCEDCMGKAVPYPGVLHNCYRDSKVQSAVVASMLTVHRARKTWTQQVDCYIALTEFARQKFIQAGLDGDKIVVKPNFLQSDPGAGSGKGDYLVFVGRLTREKGVWTLLEAMRKLGTVPLKIVGDGPDLPAMREFIQTHGLDHVDLLGRRKAEETLEIMKGARALVLTSEWCETFGRVAIESFACGVPVIASRLGAVAEVVSDGINGWHFNPGDAEDLVEKAEAAWANPEKSAAMGRAGRQTYEENYTAAHNYQLLKEIYTRVIEQRRS